MLSCVIFNKSWGDALTPKFLWCIPDIQGSSFVKFHDNWMCVDSPFVFYTWSYATGMSSEQHMLPWLCGFNSQVRMYVLSYNLIWLFFGMLGSYINFMNWFLYGWVHNVFDDCIMCFGELCDGNKIFLVLRYRFWDECVSLW